MLTVVELLLVVFILFLDKASLVVLAGLVLAMQTRLASNSEFCLPLLLVICIIPGLAADFNANRV